MNNYKHLVEEIVSNLIAILVLLANREMRMYHGAEHKVAHWYSKKNQEMI